MKTGSVSCRYRWLRVNGNGAALSCVRAGLSTGADLNSNACATLKEAGACGVSDNAATFAEKTGRSAGAGGQCDPG